MTGDNGRGVKEDALRNALRLTLGIAVSAACLWFATRGTDWDAVGRVLADARLPWVAAAVAASVLAIALRAQRWRLLLRPVAAVPLGASFSATAIGFAATSVLPLRLGEVIRPALLARRVGFGVTPALSSVVLERLFDMLFVILCFLALSLIYPLPTDLRRAALLLGGAAIAGFALLLLAQRNRARAERLLDAVLGWTPAAVGRSVRPLAGGFFDALGALESGRIVGGVVGYSTLLWTANALPFLFSILALGIHVPLVPAALASVVVVAAFIFMPQAPGFLGTWQAGCVLALDLFGTPKDLAVGFSLLTWIVPMLVNVGLGGVFVAREDLSLRQLVRGAEPAPAAEGPS
jgi:glycosyltransferase 2 family protein